MLDIQFRFVNKTCPETLSQHISLNKKKTNKQKFSRELRTRKFYFLFLISTSNKRLITNEGKKLLYIYENILLKFELFPQII